MLKTYRLTFESAPAQHAIFKREEARNQWSISSRTLREFVEHFGPKTEMLDICSQGGKTSFTSYREKVMSGNGTYQISATVIDLITTDVLKQPLHTSIAIDTVEFKDFIVEEKLHIIFSVKDFKSIVAHAGTTNTIVSAHYSTPGLPMKLEYSDDAMAAEYVLMTIGDMRNAAVSQSASQRLAARIPLDASSARHGAASSGSMAPPLGRQNTARDISKAKIVRPSPPPPPSSALGESMFIPAAADDAQWDPVDFDAEDNDMPRWDASIDHVGHNRVMFDKGETESIQDASATDFQQRLRGHGQPSQSINGHIINQNMQSTQRLPPTQRSTQVIAHQAY